MINYRGTPLFGEDSSVSHTSEFFAISGTVLFWILFLIFSLVIKPQPKKQYKEVQIVLSSTPVVQKTEESPAPAEQASASAASESSSEPVVEKVVEAPLATPKAAPIKKTETPAKPAPKKEPPKTQTQPDVPVQYGKTVEELMQEQFNARQKKKNIEDFDDYFLNDAADEYEEGQKKYVYTDNRWDGNAGEKASNDGGVVNSYSQSPDSNDNSSGYVKERNNIRNSDGSALDKPKSGEQDKNLRAGNNKDSIVWADGAGNRTVYNFDTTLSKEAVQSMLITKDIAFKISFSVDSNGNVISSSITISNEVMLSEIIKKEMRQKISSWRFGSGTGISKAEFTWILKPSN